MRIIVRGLLAVVTLAGCTPEDTGVRLRRECTSIVREAFPEWEQGPEPATAPEREQWAWKGRRLETETEKCILKRGQAGR